MWPRIMLALVFSSAGALAQTGCLAQLQPLKPLTPLGCTDTVAMCQCASNGCRWVYVCSTEPERAQQAPPDYWRIPLGVNNQPLAQQAIQGAADGLELRIQMERLRQLKMQNEAQRRSLEQPIAPAPTQADDNFNGYIWRWLDEQAKRRYTTNPAVVDEFYSKRENLDEPVERVVKALEEDAPRREPPTLEEQARDARKAFNGDVWRGLSSAVKKNFTANPKAVDQFYSRPENLLVPVEDAVEIVKAKK